MKLRSSGLWFLALPLLCMGQTLDTTPPSLVSFDFTPMAADVMAFSCRQPKRAHWLRSTISALKLKLGPCNCRFYNTQGAK